MIEIFKTNVDEITEAKCLLNLLAQNFPDCRINFDLEDCDKILRVEGDYFEPCSVMELLDDNGFSCEVLVD